MHTFKNIDSESRLIRIWSIIDGGFTFVAIEIAYFFYLVLSLFLFKQFLIYEGYVTFFNHCGRGYLN